MIAGKQIQEILANYFTLKNILIQPFERELAYHEFHKTANNILEDDKKLDWIVHTLSRSSTIEMDIFGAKKQGNEYVLFFKFAFRLNGKLITGEFEAGDDGVHFGQINFFSNSERIDFEWQDENQQHNFKKWLLNNDY